MTEEGKKRAVANLKPLRKGDPRCNELREKGYETRMKKQAERKKIKDDLDTLLKVALRKGDISTADDILNLEEAQDMNVPVQTAINIAMIKRALMGDVQAAQYLRDTVGEKPSDKVEVDQSLTIESWAKSHNVKL
jgi:hypothetical protein